MEEEMETIRGAVERQEKDRRRNNVIKRGAEKGEKK